MSVLAKKGAPLIERLMARVEMVTESGCWIWTGGQHARGYGIAFLSGGKVTLAHRAMMIAQGVDLKDQDVVCHRCDVPCCVNPDHLFVGTQADNMEDMNRKGRHRPAYKIPSVWRRRIAEDTDTPIWAIAAWFGISEKTVRNIQSGRVGT